MLKGLPTDLAVLLGVREPSKWGSPIANQTTLFDAKQTCMICVHLVDVRMDHRILSLDRGWNRFPVSPLEVQEVSYGISNRSSHGRKG